MQGSSGLSSALSFSDDWIIGDQKFKSGYDEPAPIFAFLAAHPEVFESHPEAAKDTLDRLETVDLAQKGMSDEAWKARSLLKQAHPHLFPATGVPTVRVKDSDERLSINDLAMKSLVLRQLFFHEGKDELEFFNEPYKAWDPKLKKTFVDYLKTGILSDVPDALELLRIADMYQIPDLKADLIRAIQDQLSNENVLYALESSIVLNEKQLTLECLKYIHNHNLNLTSTHKDTQDFLKSWEQLKIHQPYNPTQRSFTIDYNKSQLDDIATIFKYIDLNLTLKGNSFDNNDFRELLKRASGLRSLEIINNDKITSIPEIKNLEKLSCNSCFAVATISVPNATTINCTQCSTLATISAPNATTINCMQCSTLATISAPNATTLIIQVCPTLTSLSAPSATFLNLNACSALTSLSAPKAHSIYCPGCRSLTRENIHMPETCKVVR